MIALYLESGQRNICPCARNTFLAFQSAISGFPHATRGGSSRFRMCPSICCRRFCWVQMEVSRDCGWDHRKEGHATKLWGEADRRITSIGHGIRETAGGVTKLCSVMAGGVQGVAGAGSQKMAHIIYVQVE